MYCRTANSLSACVVCIGMLLQNAARLVIAGLLFLGGQPANLLAQEIEPKTNTQPSESETREPAPNSPKPAGSTVEKSGREFLREQIRNLASPSYRTREMAIWNLQQQPAMAIELISEHLPRSDLNTGSQLIELLSKFATQPEMSIGVAAMKSLEGIAAEKISVLAHLAQNSLQAIADTQEAMAIEILTHLGAEIGFPSLMINGMEQNVPPNAQLRIVRIDARFVGSTVDTLRFRFLQQVDVAFIHGIRVDESLVKAICQMPNLRMVVLSRVQISAEDLKLFQDAKNLDHFELAYVPVGDEVLSILEGLPVWGSMRLFGTGISKEGGEQLKKRLDGLSLYFGRGGFLGVGTQQANLIVTRVQPDSAAQRASLRVGDKLTHINSMPIRTFDDLRSQLANYGPGETIQIQYQREQIASSADVILGESQVAENPR